VAERSALSAASHRLRVAARGCGGRKELKAPPDIT